MLVGADFNRDMPRLIEIGYVLAAARNPVMLPARL
jgi:hypothetical protein